MTTAIRFTKLPRQYLLLLTLAMGIASVGHAAEQDVRNEILEAARVRGGLIVHVGCGDGQFTAMLHRMNENCLVHGIDVDSKNVEKVANCLRRLGCTGPVSVAQFDGKRLPYIDNLVNLLVADRLGDVSMVEVMRVLAPGGVAYIGQGTEWRRTVKPWPDEIDEWSHYLHGPNNNAVAHDTVVASPHHIQWVGGPKWARHHNHLSSTSAMVTSAGRLFTIVDEGPNESLKQPPQWKLVARDAFSGVVLWKKQIGPWEGHLRPFRSGPTELARRLVAVGDRVYVTPGYGRPLVALDAASGKLVHQYAETEDAVEFVCDDGVLYTVTGAIDPTRFADTRRRGAASPLPRGKRILAIRADTAQTLWTKDDRQTAELLPTTLCVAAGKVYFQDPGAVVCLDATTGQVSWTTPRPTRVDRLAWSTPTLVVVDDVVLSADCTAEADPSGTVPTKIEWKVTSGPKRNDDSLGELIAFSTGDGRELWRSATRQGYTAPTDLFVADGLVWGNAADMRHSTDFTEGRDLHTGQVLRRINTDAVYDVAHHHRCYRNKATDRFVLLGRAGVALVDLTGQESLRHSWVRGACQYGVMPANGLLYTPPHSCACYIQSKLSGLWALAPKRETPTLSAEDGSRLERGPAFGELPSSSAASRSDDWPTFRHDVARSGATVSEVGDDLKPGWRVELGGRLTAPVIAEGRLLVASIDAHTLHALDAADGKLLWRRQLGARIDSPPTIHQGTAIVGCADGYVYCLRLNDGQLVWRFLAARTDRRTVSFGQLESVWPVTGSVLVQDGVVYCTAGRSSYLDGGMTLYRLNPTTGEILGETLFYDRDPISGKQFETDDVELPGALPDVLVCDGHNVFLRDKVLDLQGVEQNTYLPHVYCSAGLLDDTWWHRTFYLWGERDWGRASGWSVMPDHRPSGRILVTDESTVFGYGRKSVKGPGMQSLQLFRSDKRVEPRDGTIKNNNVALTRLQRPAKVNYHWRRDAPLVARAMVLTPDALLAAGPIIEPDQARGEPTFDADSPSVLMAFAPTTGSDLFRLPLDSGPVFNGMAVAGGRVFICEVDGAVVCYTGP